MIEGNGKFDGELGELVRFHRIARGISIEDLAAQLGLPPVQVERYESGKNRLSVYRYWTIMTVLKQDPSLVLERLGEKMSQSEERAGDFEESSAAFMASNRGRKVIGALAMCNEPKVFDALADLIIAVGVQARAKVRLSNSSGNTSIEKTRTPS